MNKQEFIVKVAEKLDTTQKEARQILDAVFETIEDGLVEGKKIPLGDLGRLVVVERAARKGYNPATGEAIQIPARNAVAYRPSKHAKELVR